MPPADTINQSPAQLSAEPSRFPVNTGSGLESNWLGVDLQEACMEWLGLLRA
jgi:hypothetical protein